jgi:hypothetical protein
VKHITQFELTQQINGAAALVILASAALYHYNATITAKEKYTKIIAKTRT